jgi:hypothetical protein
MKRSSIFFALMVSCLGCEFVGCENEEATAYCASAPQSLTVREQKLDEAEVCRTCCSDQDAERGQLKGHTCVCYGRRSVIAR